MTQIIFIVNIIILVKLIETKAFSLKKMSEYNPHDCGQVIVSMCLPSCLGKGVGNDYILCTSFIKGQQVNLS